MKYVILAGLILLFGTTAHAQDNLTIFAYNMAISDGDTKNYIEDPSFRGFSFEGRKRQGAYGRTSIGLSGAWQVFNERTSGTQEIPNGAVTGVQRRYINSLPFMLTGHFYLGRQGLTQLFIGTGIGAIYNVQRFEIGVQILEESKWQFGVTPEVGVFLPFENFDLMISGKYVYGVPTGDSVAGEGEGLALQYYSINIGLSYSHW